MFSLFIKNDQVCIILELCDIDLHQFLLNHYKSNTRIDKQRLFISKLPKILIIRLKPSVGLNSLVLYDFKLDMAEFFKGDNCMNEETEYNLIGVVNHYGTENGGHCK